MSTASVPVAIRLDGTDPAPLLACLDKDGGAYLIVKELEGSNPHFHVVLHSVRKLSAIRQQIKRAMPEINGNGSYSVTTVRDLAKYERYMMKGESADVMPQITAAHGMTYTQQDWQLETHDAYWAENELLTRKRKAAPMIETVLQACKAKQLSWQSREVIAQEYIRELVARGKTINLFATKSAVNLIQVQLCPNDNALEDLARQV